MCGSPGSGLLSRPAASAAESAQILIGSGLAFLHAGGFSLRAMAQFSSSVVAFGRWLAEMIQHAFGDPRAEAALQPPAVGVQPYHGTIQRRRGRRLMA